MSSRARPAVPVARRPLVLRAAESPQSAWRGPGDRPSNGAGVSIGIKYRAASMTPPVFLRPDEAHAPEGWVAVKPLLCQSGLSGALRPRWRSTGNNGCSGTGVVSRFSAIHGRRRDTPLRGVVDDARVARELSVEPGRHQLARVHLALRATPLERSKRSWKAWCSVRWQARCCCEEGVLNGADLGRAFSASA
jgi:hypothetical protein